MGASDCTALSYRARFLHHFKGTGAHTSARLSTLGPAQLRQLLRGWDRDCPNGVEISCAIHYLIVEKAGGCDS